MQSKHLFKLSSQAPDEHTEGGFRIKANKKNFPILQNMSLYELVLKPFGIREPHWHANADELGYCLQGKVLIRLYHTGDARASFLVEEGDSFLIPSGALHSLENVGEKKAQLVLSFSHEAPEDFALSSSFGAFSDAVLGNTWHVDASVFQTLKRSLKESFATLRKGTGKISQEAYYKTPYHYSLEKSEPILINEGGSVRMARQNVWPIAKKQALYSLKLTGKGMREPHWHPETSELGYIVEGKGRMSVLNPGNSLETYTMEKGDIYFIPKAYPHHIENLTEDLLQVLVFFDQPMPGDIGFTAGVRSHTDEVLASCLHTQLDFFQQLDRYYSDLFIVSKINPLD